MQYFSDQELGGKPRSSEEIPQSVWGGIVGLIGKHKADGYLGFGFPAECNDGKGIVGCHVPNFNLAVNAEIPKLEGRIDPSQPPDTLTILDLIQFCHKNIGEPILGNWHTFFEHNHYDGFNEEKGKYIFQKEIEGLFARNGIAFQLRDDGSIVRMGSAVLMSPLLASDFNTGDQTLNDLLNQARAKFLNPDTVIRQEGLEKLWDAWERIKTLEPPNTKPASITALWQRVSTQAEFKVLLDEEGKDLTSIGNNFKIRHTETTQKELESSAHVDYLFHRLFALIELILKTTNRLK